MCNHVQLQGVAYHNDLPQLQENADRTEEVLSQVFSLGVKTKLNALLDDGLPKIQSTEDSLRLVDRILRMLEEEEEDQGKDERKPSTSPKPKGNDSNSSGNDSGSKPKKDNSKDSGGNQKTGHRVIQEALNAVDGDLPESKTQLIQGMLQEAKTDHYRVAKPAPAHSFKRGSFGEAAYENALRVSSGARKQLQRIVESAYRKNPKSKPYGYRLDQNRIHRAMFADPNVFIHDGRRQKKDTAIHLLLDGSPSMKNVMRLAIEATIGLGLGLERIQGMRPCDFAFPD